MFSLRTVVGSAIAAVALFASVQGASAIPLNPYTSQVAAGLGAVQGPLTIGPPPVYELNPVLPAAAFTHFYKFSVPAGGVDSLIGIQVHAPNATGGIGVANLQLTWLDAAFAPIAGGFLDITTGTGAFEAGRSQNEVFTASLAAGVPVYLLVEGTRIGETGRYNFNLYAQQCTNCGNDVPVPGAVFLFGSVLAGGIGGMQLMRRRRTSRAA